SREVVSSSRWAALSTSGALCVLVSLAVVPDSVVVPHAASASVSTAAAASGVCSFMMRLSLVWNYFGQVRAWAAVLVVMVSSLGTGVVPGRGCGRGVGHGRLVIHAAIASARWSGVPNWRNSR